MALDKRIPFGVLASVWSLTVLAQAEVSAGSPVDAPVEAIRDPTLENIVVTAEVQAPMSAVGTRFQLGVLGDVSVLDAPFSINVITRDLLDKQQAAVLGDFMKNDPSAVVGTVPVSFATLRGFPVASYLYDGLPANDGDGNVALTNVERVDILKGPSTFLNGLGGSTSLGGSLNYIIKRPLDAPVRSVSANYINQSLYEAQADVGDRFGVERQFGYRVNAAYRDGETAVDDYDWTQRAVSVAMDWKLQPGLDVSIGFDYLTNSTPRLQPFYAVSPGIDVPDPPEASNNMAAPWDRFETRNINYYARADWEFATDWSLTAQLLDNTSERPNVQEARFGFILDDAGNTLMFASEDANRQDTTTGRLLVHGDVSTGALAHKLTFGVTASEEESTGGSNSLGTYFSNLYQPAEPPRPPGQRAPLQPQQRTLSSSAVASDVVTFNRHWSLLAGLSYLTIDLYTYDPSTGVRVSSTSLTEPSPAAALMFKPTDESMLYVNYAEGVEQGGTAPQGTLNADQQLNPVVTQQVEFGARIELEALRLTAALFDINKPLEYVDASTQLFVQNGEQRHRGVELMATGQVLPSLSVVAGTMYIDATEEDTGDPATDGQRPVGVARFTANLFAEYRVAALQGLFVNAGVYYSDSAYLDAANTQSIDAWTRYDVGARYSTHLAGAPVEFFATVENVANDDYWASAISGILTLANPRTYKLTARCSF